VKANLTLHCGARRVERDQLPAVATPGATRSWHPIPHHQLLDGVQQTLERTGLHVVSEAHGLTRDGARYFGLLQVADGHADGAWGLVVGLRNSHDKSFPAALCCGSQVFVCDNLAFNGQVKLARKHTRHISRDLPRLIEQAVGQLGTLRLNQEKRYLTYQTTEVADARAHDLVIQALDARVLPVTQVPAVLRGWREPRHREFRAAGKTLWRLQQAFTEALKGNLDALPRRTMALAGILDTACGLAAGAEAQLAQAT
jgi:hypothetical protein